VFHRRSRMLKARIAKAPTEREMRAHRDALARLNDIYHLANALRPHSGPGPDLADEGTLSDVVGFGQTEVFDESASNRHGRALNPAESAERDKRLTESAFELEILLPGDAKGKRWRGPEETL